MSWPTLVQDLQALSGADPKRLVLIGMVPIFFIAMLAELWHYRGTRIYGLKDSLASVTLGGSYLAIEAVVSATFVIAISGWVYAHRVATIPINAWTFALLYVLGDLCFYVNHRVSHRVRWFWSTHVVHHASEHMNFTTAARQSTLTVFAGAWVFYMPLVLLGFDPQWVLMAMTINLAYQYFLHTQWVPKLPAAIELIFNTPSHHRAHHGRNARYIDRNYGGTFIVFDRLFGSFVEESETEPPEYGIVRQVHSYNPVRLTLHEWADMFRDVARPGPLAQRLQHLWRPPEWQRAAAAPQTHGSAVQAQGGQSEVNA